MRAAPRRRGHDGGWGGGRNEPGITVGRGGTSLRGWLCDGRGRCRGLEGHLRVIMCVYVLMCVCACLYVCTCVSMRAGACL